MLNGGMSLSATFMAGQVKPQARLTATSMRRPVGSAVSRGAGLAMIGMFPEGAGRRREGRLG